MIYFQVLTQVGLPSGIPTSCSFSVQGLPLHYVYMYIYILNRIGVLISQATFLPKSDSQLHRIEYPHLENKLGSGSYSPL